MSGRERRRAERRKRKRRRGQPEAPSRSELKDQAAREALEPLGEGERPRVVTVGAFVASAIALVFLTSGVVAVVTGIEVEGEEPNPVPLFAFGGVLAIMAWGMFRVRYWAVLGFQALLVLFMLAAAAGFAQLDRLTVLQVIGNTLVLALAGTLFYFMIKALARIQMPESPGRRR